MAQDSSSSNGSSNSSTSALLYAVVAHKSALLCHYHSPTVASTNLREICASILDRIPAIDSRMSYGHDCFLFHYVVESEFVFLAVASERVGKRIPFCFLDDIRIRFKHWRQQRASSSSSGYSLEYAKFTEEILIPRFEFFNSEPTLEAIQASRTELSLSPSPSPSPPGISVLTPPTTASGNSGGGGGGLFTTTMPERVMLTPLDVVRIVGGDSSHDRENFALLSENFSVYADGSVKSGRVPFDPYDRGCGLLCGILVLLVVLFLLGYSIYYKQDTSWLPFPGHHPSRKP